MSRILSAALLRQTNAWVLGMGLAVSLMIGCGSKGDSSDDSSVTGGAGYQVGTSKGGVGGVIYLTSVGGNRATGGRNNGQGGQVVGQGGRFGTGGAPVTTPSSCNTGTVNCPCFSSGICASGLTCNASKICVGTPTGTGGAAATGGAKSTAGSPATGGANPNVGGTTAAANVGGHVATGGAVAAGGTVAVVGGSSGITVSGGSTSTAAGGSTSLPRCDDAVVNTPNGVIACTGDCAVSGTIASTGTTLSYECDCAGGLYVCFAGSSTTVACPAAIAIGSDATCTPGKDDFCSLTATTTKTDGATTTTTTTTYNCTCGATSKLWTCPK